MDRRKFIKEAARGVLLVAGTPLIFSCLKNGAVMKNNRIDSKHNFSQTKEDLRKILNQALNNGGDFADLYFEERTGFSLFLEEEMIKRADQAVDLGCGIRTVKGDSVGYSYTEDLQQKSLISCAKTASQIANEKSQVINNDFTVEKFKNYYPITESPLNTKIKGKLALLELADKKARTVSNLVKKVDVSYSEVIKQVMIVSSEGKIANDFRPMISIRCRVIVEKKGRFENGYAAFSARKGFEAMTKQLVGKIAKQAASYALENLEALSPPAGKMPVILAPAESGVLLHEAIGHGLEADYNKKNSSKYSGKMGQLVASKYCTVVDDGTIKEIGRAHV